MNRILTEHRDDFDEVYHIFETAEFLKGGHHVRIEIYQAIHSDTKHFDVVAYEMKDNSWVRWREIPWIDEPSPEAAMEKAVGYLKEKMGPQLQEGAEDATEDVAESEEPVGEVVEGE